MRAALLVVDQLDAERVAVPGAAGAGGRQWPRIMARARSLPCITSIVTDVTPRTWAPVINARTSADPTPWCCQVSDTTTPMSVDRSPHGPGTSAAIPCPMMMPSRVASRASVAPAPPHSRVSRDGPGVMGEKNLR